MAYDDASSYKNLTHTTFDPVHYISIKIAKTQSTRSPIGTAARDHSSFFSGRSLPPAALVTASLFLPAPLPVALSESVALDDVPSFEVGDVCEDEASGVMRCGAQ